MARVIAIAGNGSRMLCRIGKMDALLHHLAKYGLGIAPEVCNRNTAIRICWSRGPYSQKARRDFSDWQAQPESEPKLKSTRRVFLLFRGRFADPPNSMVILRPTVLQAKLLDYSARRRGGRKGSVRAVATNNIKQNPILNVCQSTLPARGQASSEY